MFQSFNHSCIHSFNNNDQDRHSVFFLLRLTSYSIRARAAALGEDWGSAMAYSRQMGPRHESGKVGTSYSPETRSGNCRERFHSLVLRKHGLPDRRPVCVREGFRPSFKDSEWECLAFTDLHLSPALELSSGETLDKFLNFSESTFLIYS